MSLTFLVGVLFPHGLSEGDMFMETTVDGNSGELPIAVPFPFFDKDHFSLFVRCFCLNLLSA